MGAYPKIANVKSADAQEICPVAMSLLILRIAVRLTRRWFVAVVGPLYPTQRGGRDMSDVEKVWLVVGLLGMVILYLVVPIIGERYYKGWANDFLREFWR